MVNLEIPGFYYDDVRRKYFRIVNGDQRINSTYHNNTVRALTRQKKYQDEHQETPSFKRTKTSSMLDNLSRASQMHILTGDFSCRYLQLRLGHGDSAAASASQLRIEYSLEGNNYHLLSKKQIFAGLDDETVFAFDGNVVELTNIYDLVRQNPKPLGRHTVLTSLPLHNIINYKDYVFIHGESQFSLLQWQLVNGTFRVLNHTMELQRIAREEFDRQGLDTELLGSIIAQIDKTNLIIISSQGFVIIFDILFQALPLITKVPHGNFENLTTYGSVSVHNNFAFFNASKALFAYNFKKRFYKWTSPEVIYAFFAEPIIIKSPENRDEHFMRLRIVTRKKILILMFSYNLKKFTKAHPDIHLHNDNNAMPLIQMARGLLIVQESKTSLKIINTHNNTMRLLSLLAPLPASRGAMPRLLHRRNILLLCHSDKTFKFSG